MLLSTLSHVYNPLLHLQVSPPSLSLHLQSPYTVLSAIPTTTLHKEETLMRKVIQPRLQRQPQ